MNHFLLHLLAASVSRDLIGRRISGAHVLPPVMTFAFRGEKDFRYGVVVMTTPGPFFFVDSVDPIAGTGAEVFRRIEDFTVRAVTVPAGERVLRFELGGTREPVTLALYLFGSTAKVRVEGPVSIIESSDAAEGGGPLPIPRSIGGDSLVTAGTEAFVGGTGSADFFARGVPGVTPELLDNFSAPDGALQTEGLLRFRDALLERGLPFVLGTRKGLGAVCPLPAVDPTGGRPVRLAAEFGPFTDAAEACRCVGGYAVAGLRSEIVERFAAPLAKYLAGRRRLLAALEADREKAECFESLRREADILAAYQARIRTGSTSVTLPNLYGDGEVSMELEPSASIPDQIKKRYRRAAKLERSRGALERRMRSVGEEIEVLERELSAARGSSSLADAIRPVERLRRRFGLEQAPRREERVRSKSKDLRRIDLDEQWFVLVGRSDRENDEITFRVAAPEDIWLHAQHLPGSHVVLRSRGAAGNPPNLVLEKAAAIAAHYSKGRRASVVPVIYTRRKYVRKFRGAKPGQVVCEREKTILVEPGIPDSGAE